MKHIACILVLALTLASCTPTRVIYVQLPGVSGWTVNSSNSEERGYVVQIETPNSEEPDFRNISIKFGKSLEGDFKYTYSKALYSMNNKSLLYYRPEDISFVSADQGEIRITGDTSILSCLSVVNVYHKQGDYGFHPPSTEVNIALGSFLKVSTKCVGSQSASNVW